MKDWILSKYDYCNEEKAVYLKTDIEKKNPKTLPMSQVLTYKNHFLNSYSYQLTKLDSIYRLCNKLKHPENIPNPGFYFKSYVFFSKCSIQEIKENFKGYLWGDVEGIGYNNLDSAIKI